MLTRMCPVRFELSSIQMKQLVPMYIYTANSLGMLKIKPYAYEYAIGDLRMK
jgi:hypothetical protein